MPHRVTSLSFIIYYKHLDQIVCYTTDQVPKSNLWLCRYKINFAKDYIFIAQDNKYNYNTHF